MRKRFSILLWVLLAAVVGGIGWVVLRSREPVYQGKRLSEWLERYDGVVKQGNYDLVKRQVPDEAVRHIGTNAIPFLLQRLRAKDSPLGDKFYALVQRQHFFKVAHTPAWVRHEEAEMGFLALGDEGRGAVPELLAMCEDAEFFESRISIVRALGFIGPGAKPAVPLLVRWLGETNWGYCPYAAQALGNIRVEPEVVVPALVACLRNQNGFMRMNSATALGNYGADAKAAVPELLTLLNDSDNLVSGAAKVALARIDPVAASRAEARLKVEAGMQGATGSSHSP